MPVAATHEFSRAGAPCERRWLLFALYPLGVGRDEDEPIRNVPLREFGERLERGELTSGRDLHRALLAEIRRHPRYSWERHRLDQALKVAREHSDLYSPRRCVCMRRAFSDMWDPLLDRLAGGGCSVEFEVVTVATGARSRERDIKRLSSNPSLYPMPNSARWEDHGARLRVEWSTPGRQRAYDVWPLTADDVNLSSRIEGSCLSAPIRHRACDIWWLSCRALLPATVIGVLDAYLQQPRALCAGDAVELLLSLGVAGFSDAELLVAREVGAQWNGTLPDLVSYARAVAAPPVDRLPAARNIRSQDGSRRK